MKKLVLLFLVLIPAMAFSQLKVFKYLSYYVDCISTTKDTIIQSGNLRFDTIQVTEFPTKSTYKLDSKTRTIGNWIKVSPNLYNLQLIDTIWCPVSIPTYRDSYDYYNYPGHIVPTVTIDPNVNLSDKHLVFKKKVVRMRKQKPLAYSEWNP